MQFQDFDHEKVSKPVARHISRGSFRTVGVTCSVAARPPRRTGM
jgi:hypothetical protein